MRRSRTIDWLLLASLLSAFAALQVVALRNYLPHAGRWFAFSVTGAQGADGYPLVDRLNAPNTEAGFAPIRPELQSFLEGVYQVPLSVARFGSASEPLSVRIRAESAPDLGTLIDRVGGSIFATQKKQPRVLKIA